jgi:hypothetical protein
MRATSAAIPGFDPKLPIASGGFEAVLSISQAPGFGRKRRRGQQAGLGALGAPVRWLGIQRRR